MFTRPLRLVEPTSWVPHIPFAFWIVNAQRPATVVELGTMSGNSFAAMAQGVQALGLDAACYAVDTWKGDPHTGFYAEQVFEEWLAFHDQQFGAFSRLVRSTFDDARAKFDDGSIDLLHIDGFHTYEAVRHDFEAWLPKLSSRGVVLLHDINVRELDFGVWKLWDELSQQYPCFSFLHGHGLGVVGVGRELTTDVQMLVGELSRSSQDTAVVRQFFGTLGEALLRQPREAELARREAVLRGEIAASAAETSRLASALEEQRAQTEREHAQLELERVELARRELELRDARVEVEQLSSASAVVRAELDGNARWMCEAESRLAGLQDRLRAVENELQDRAHRLTAQAADVQAAAHALREVRSELDVESGRLRAALKRVDQEATGAFGLVVALRQSRRWRLTAPFRRTMALGRALVRRARLRNRLSRQPASLRGFLYPSLGAQARLVARSGVFDAAFYLRQASGGTNQADIAAAWAEPLFHYLSVGAFTGLDPHPLFDSAFYLRRNPDVARMGVDPLTHYLRFGGFEGRDPHPLFHSTFYLEQSPDVAADRTNPLVHYLLFGAREGRDPNPWFDTSFYLDTNPSLRESGENPLMHFLRVGGADGRSAGPSFDTGRYLRANPDVVQEGINPLVHFIIAGQMEGPRTTAEADAPATIPAAGDIRASAEAYDALSVRAREAEALRIRNLVVRPPMMIRVSERDDLRGRTREVHLRGEQAPLVSIVIPVVNGIRFTLECLLSIAQFTRDVAIEVIVVDNGSTDESKDLLSAIPHLRYVRHEQNLGFGPGCNAGAAIASGQYVVFLNNDVQVQAGWLPEMLRTFSESDDIGAVGPKVVFPDGRLQDAGSTINSDCMSTLIGVFDDPDLPRFNYSRDVPYLSAVCLMVLANRFRSSGGFDGAFAPAYCEDVDLCLRFRRDGLRIVYQPSAVVVHHLSATSNKLGTSFKMAAVTRNQQEISVRHQAQIDALGRPRVIAFYLPQFYPIPENDVWWGKGFTEWRNVTRARPSFPEHYQPRLAGDLGFYDLRLRETYVHQIALAERYGVDGFCFYYYWFDGKRLLERPLERMLEDSSIDFPFCICWANENWTRRWDGQEQEILMSQAHRTEDDVAVIADLVRYVRHSSYIRVNGRPLLLVYNATRFPDIRRTVQTWRSECRARGIGEIYLAMVQSFELAHQKITPIELGFDAAVEFPPHNGGLHPMPDLATNPQFRGQVFSYEHTALHYLTKSLPGYKFFRTVMPGWDNTARRLDDAVVFAGSTPGAYQAWLEGAIHYAREQLIGDEQLVFINAWNEWAEGAYLEPDLGWGHSYLEATRDARDNVRLGLR